MKYTQLNIELLLCLLNVFTGIMEDVIKPLKSPGQWKVRVVLVCPLDKVER